jgi:MFS family permease
LNNKVVQNHEQSYLSSRSSLKASAVWGLAAIFYLYELMLLVSPSVMHDDLSEVFNTSAEQLGSLAAFYYYSYAFMQIPVGLLMDRYGPRILLTIASLTCTVGCFIFASAEVLWVAQLGRFVMGIGGSFAVVGCLKLASLWFPVNRFALLTGLMVAIGMMGGVFGQAPVAKLVIWHGWRETMYLGSIAGAVLSVIIWWVIYDHPSGLSLKSLKPVASSSRWNFLHELWIVMKIPQIWVASLYAGLMFVPTTGFGQLWGVPYFSERFHLEKDAAGFMVSMIFFGWAIGGPFYGWLSDRIGLRKLPMVVAALGTMLIMTTILFAPVGPIAIKLLMFLLGAMSSGFILAFSIVREINLPMLTGTAIGLINTLNNLSGALAQPIVGKILDKQWDGTLLPNGHPAYSLEMYNSALLFLPICLFVALLLMPFIKETYCRPTVTRIDM